MIEKITKEAIALLKQLIETQSFSSEEDSTALLIANWFTTHQIPFKRNKNKSAQLFKFFIFAQSSI